MTTQVTKVWWDGEKLMAEPIAESEIYKSQQEPVAISLNTGTKQGVKWLKNVEHGESLYTSPPQPQQEPVAWQKIECPICGEMAIATDIPPPQRTWQGLTDEEAVECWPGLAMYADCALFWKNIENKLMEKNT